jgi:hypothetical protein
MKYAHLKLKFIPPNFNPIILKIFHCLLPIFLKLRTRPWLVAGIKQIKVFNPDIMVNLYEQFQDQKIRFLIAFRHPEVDDPLCLMYLLSRPIPQVAKAQHIKLKYPIHSHFIYDRGMTIWAGNWLGWLFAKGGGIPIHRGKPLDRQALKTARTLILNGQFPMAIAPEGANNGHSEIVSILEPGVAQLSWWCVQDLLKENRAEKVLILPLNIQYQYVKSYWQKLEKLLSKLEKDCGLNSIKITHNMSEAIIIDLCYKRLLRLSDKMLTSMENFYTCFYHCSIPKVNLDVNFSAESLSQENQLIARLEILLDTALTVAEDFFSLHKQGNIIDRCRRLEEASWHYIYREDIENWHDVSAMEKGLAEWVAQEAEIRIKNMRLVESFVAVTANYIKEKPSFERFAETALILFDVMARIKGKKTPKRPRLGERIATLTIGNPINVTESFAQAQTAKLKQKQAVKDLTKQLQKAFESTSIKSTKT